jgi:hypothetical protein
MDDDDFRVTSEVYRLMPPRKRPGSELGEALDAARVTRSELREAVDTARGKAPESADPAGAISWSADSLSRQRRWLRSLSRPFARVDVWILIVGIIGLVIAYLAWVKPH